MLLRLEIILSVMSYERKNIIFHEKNLKVTKNNTINDFLILILVRKHWVAKKGFGLQKYLS